MPGRKPYAALQAGHSGASVLTCYARFTRCAQDDTREACPALDARTASRKEPTMITTILPQKTPIEQPENTIPLQAPQQSRNHFAGYVFFILFAATLLNGLDASEFTGAIGIIARDLHLSIDEVGILASAFTLFLK